MPSMKRIAALMLAALMLAGAAVFAGCRGGKDEPSATQPASQEDEEKARILILAETFAGYGDYDCEKGFKLSEGERLLACRYRSHLAESEIPGYGKISFEEAEKELERMLGIGKLGALLHTPRKSEDQEIFAENGAYFIKLYEPEYEYELLSAEPVKGEESPAGRTFAIVEASQGGEKQFSIELLLYRAESGEFYVRTAKKYLVR